MTDRRGKRAPPEAEPLDESSADIAVTPVTFEHADLEQITLRVRVTLPVSVQNAGLQMLGENLAGDDPDHRRRRPRSRHGKRLRRDRPETDGIRRPAAPGDARDAKLSGVTLRPCRKTE